MSAITQVATACLGTRKPALLLVLLGLGLGNISHALTTQAISTRLSSAPVDSRVEAIRFDLAASLNGDDIFRNITVRNTASVAFGDGIKSVEIYVDSNGNGIFDETGDGGAIGSASFSGPSSQEQKLTLTAQQSLTSTSSATIFFVVYEVDTKTNATIGGQTNIEITKINDLASNLNNLSASNTLTITGFKSFIAVDKSPSVVLPGQVRVAMLELFVQMGGEGADKNISLVLENDSANFITSENDQNGIRSVYLYKRPANYSGEFDTEFVTDSDIAKIVTLGKGNNTNTTVSFNFTTDLTFPKDVTSNFWVVYDFGDNISVTSNTKVSAQLVRVSGTGSSTKVTIQDSTRTPAAAVSALVGGLSTDELANIVPAGSTFGENSTIPLLRFSLKAHHATMNINTIQIDNPGTVQFTTSSSNPNNVQRIRVFEDTDRNGEFGGIGNSSDTLVGDLALGTGSNEKTTAEISLSNLALSAFDSTKSYFSGNNEKKLFVVFDIGGNIQVTDPNNTGLKTVIAQIREITATASIATTGNISVKLSGNKPVSANPEASVTLSQANVFISEITDLAANNPSVIRGHSKIPVLAIKLTANTAITSANFVINNEQNTFLKNNTGVTKVWVYKENSSGTAKVLDSSDTLMGSDTVSDNVSNANIFGVPLGTGENNFLVLYDIGQEATLAANRIAAQLADVKGDADNTVILAGQVPAPTVAAKLSVADKPLRITTVTTTADSASNLDSTFNITINVANSGSQSYTVSTLRPRIYLSNIGGVDISHEFTITTNQQSTFTVNSNANATVVFDARHHNRLSNGTVVLDGFVNYTVSNNTAVLSRYFSGSGWRAASETTPPKLAVAGTTTTYNWSFPPYISDITWSSGAASRPFANGNAIAPNSQLKIQLANSGANIEESSLKITLNSGNVPISASSLGFGGRTLFRTQTASYTYDRNAGLITISDIGTTDGSITIAANDLEGNALETAQITFQIDSAIRITDALFYPNPYQISGNNLTLGFNITQPATVKVYVYSYLGVEVWSGQESFSTLGYHRLSAGVMQNLRDSIASGMYIAKVIAESGGKQAMALTKLAVY